MDLRKNKNYAKEGIVMKKYISLLFCVLLLLCGCTPRENQNGTNGQSEMIHDHTPFFRRQADSFFVYTEKKAEVTDYIICYKEPDGCITSIAAMGNYEQSFIIHNKLIYYVERDGGCRLCAIDFAGNVQKECQLQESLDTGWLLYSDEEYIYGAAGSHATSNATYIFQTDWDLSECEQIPAFPRQFRQFDYRKVGGDFAEICQTETSKIYVHGANVLFDANGMAYEMLIMVSAVSETDTISGNLLLGWYNQLPAYDTWDMNPWFNKVEEGYGSVDGLMTLSQFLNQLKAIEDSSVIPEYLPSSSKPFRLTSGVGIAEDLPTSNTATEVYVDLTEGTPNIISTPDTTKSCFSIVSKDSETIIGTLNILIE